MKLDQLGVEPELNKVTPVEWLLIIKMFIKIIINSSFIRIVKSRYPKRESLDQSHITATYIDNRSDKTAAR